MSDTLIPPHLLADLEAAAAEERRPAGEIVGEVVQRYLDERRWLPRDRVDAQIAAGLESLRRGDVVDGENFMRELLADIEDRPHRPQ